MAAPATPPTLNFDGIDNAAAKDLFDAHGFLQINNLLSLAEDRYRQLYQDFIDGKIDCGSHRRDLTRGRPTKRDDIESILQVMWPCDKMPTLLDDVLHQRGLELAKAVIGDDAAFDFDMIMCKPPHTEMSTPFHQDAFIWLDQPDKRAVSIWVALDDVFPENGCMWYGPGSHKDGLRPHERYGKEGEYGVTCKGSEDECVPMPLTPGSCGLHGGQTVHYSRGNSTDTWRRAYILNYRPKSMVEYERAKGFDHGRAGARQNQDHVVNAKPLDAVN
eukprot:m.77858 g.77858  ORF g.77858 m.77858 type:complete len:274 (+) comp14488_c0_seq4:1183-2004(+)